MKTNTSAQIRARLVNSLFVAVAVAVTLATPSNVFAGAGTVQQTGPSFQWELQCIRTTNLTVDECRAASLVHDPMGSAITGFTLQLKYDNTLFQFDPTHSGPLGEFSVGGDAPPPNAGVGTTPIQLLPSSGYNPGAPLPGSTLTYTDVNGLLTVTYQLASGISMNTDINFFRTDFLFLHPIFIDLSKSTVTYETSGSGSDVSLISFACTTTNFIGGCSSDSPSTGITENLDTVPEPGSLLLMGSGVMGLAGFLRKRLLMES